MRILIAPDKFKGSMTAVAAARAIAEGLREAIPPAECTLAPIADGGEGFADAMCTALGGEWIECLSRDAIGREITGHYAWVEQEKTAIVEMAEASGLWRLRASERDPLHAHTGGTGDLIHDAIRRGAARVLVGLGGSATTDGGVGMAQALGYVFLDSAGQELPPTPIQFERIARIENRAPEQFPEIVAACDVQNPLLGERGSAHVFGPQKGADPVTVEHLERGLAHLAEVVHASLGRDFREVPGAGAAGGIGYGLMTFAGARLESGFDLVARTVKLEEKIAATDLVVTGEGFLDGQTLEGKGPAGVAGLARRLGKPVIAFGGGVDPVAENLFDATVPITEAPTPLEEAVRRGAELLRRAARRSGRLISLFSKP